MRQLPAASTWIVALLVVLSSATLSASVSAPHDGSGLLGESGGTRPRRGAAWARGSRPPAPAQRKLLQAASGRGRQTILYITRHMGTLADFKAVCNSIGCNWRAWNPEWNPPGLTDYGIDGPAAEDLFGKLFRSLCSYADAFVVCDTIVDARPLLAHGACGGKPVVLLVTNRFDYHVQPQDRPAYYRLMAGAAAQPNVRWVLNNPYEETYLRQRGVRLPAPPRTRLIRPVGHSPFPGLALDLAAAPAAPNGMRLAALLTHNQGLLTASLAAQRVAFTPFGARAYGGPRTLALFDAVLELPYQCSLMRIVENLAAGVVHLVPSARMLAALLTDPAHIYHYGCFQAHERRLDLESQVQHIERISEYHNPEFSSYMLFYDSWQHLAALLAAPATAAAAAAKRQAALQRFRPANASDVASSPHGLQVVTAWRRLLADDLGLQVPAADQSGCGAECSALGSEPSNAFIASYGNGTLRWNWSPGPSPSASEPAEG